jgi:1-phosphofructokinase family hexose kinase
VLIAGPNLTIDRTIGLDELRPGEVLRAKEAHASPGGKGVNVVRAAVALGARAELVAFLPQGRTGEAVGAWLADERVALHAVPVPGEVRSAAIMLEADGRTTVLNEPGPPVSEDAWRRYADLVRVRLEGHSVLVCSGSTPPGSPDDAYARLVRIAAEHDAIAIVDAAGGTLEAALTAAPDVVTPNLAEAEEMLTGTGRLVVDATATIAERAAEAAQALVRPGARAALVTAGAAGLALAGELGERWLEASRVTARNPIGAGDALVAGLGSALESGEPDGEAILIGMAAASASVEQPLPGRLDATRVGELRERLGRAHGASPEAGAAGRSSDSAGARFRDRPSG